jgi:arylsulfatase A-like enzyme
MKTRVLLLPALLLTGLTALAAPPNILLIVADDVGAEASSLHKLAGKAGPAPMPNLEKLASGGLVFDNVWVNPMCSPTRATILTGLYGHHTGVLVAGDILDPSITTIWEYLRKESPAKYDVGLFGKFHLGGNGNNAQHMIDMHLPQFRGFLGAQIQDYYKWNSWDETGKATEITTYSTTAITDWGVDFIKKHNETRPQDPWFLYMPYNAAHAPFQVPPENLHTQKLGDLKPGDRSATVPVYKAMIEALDTEIGRLLKSVDLSKTLVIYIGDNGTPSNVKDEDAKVRNSKTSVYEGGARVSMVIAGAGVTRTGREPALVNGVDLYATMAATAGIPITRANDGYSLVPLLSNATASSGREFSLTEFCTAAAKRYAVRDRQYKLLFDNKDGWAMFDLGEDLSETNNVYGKPAYAVPQARLQKEIDRTKAAESKGCFQ